MKVYRSNRPERLVDSLVELLAKPPVGIEADPMDQEMVVVGSQGMERWLTQQIAQRVGICARVEFPFPGALVRKVFSAVLGADPEALELWNCDRLLWFVLDRLPSLLATPEFRALQSYLDETPETEILSRRRLQLARRIAETFDRYLAYRPEMVLEWESGEGEDGDWQPILWRALRDRIPGDHVVNRAEAFHRKIATSDQPLEGLPPRVFLFGVSTLPPFHVDVLAALARRHEVHLFVPSPARDYWAEMQSEREAERLEKVQGLPADDLHIERLPPLLDAFGRLFRDFQGVLVDRVSYDEPVDDLLFEEPGRDSMLHGLQTDVLELICRGDTDVLKIAAQPGTDRSIRIHACHGPMRQVEVLHDELLALFDAEPTLEPRHVVVMTPDLETYAPLVDAVFSDGDEGVVGPVGFPRIPFRVADRSLRTVNPVAEALLTLLETATGRLTASSVLDLLASDAIRDRFDIGIDDLPQIRRWIAACGIAWGIDENHRAAVDQPATRENTWRFGLDRLLLGIALRGEGRELFEGVLPYDEVEGTETELLGRFAELVERLILCIEDSSDPHSLAEWRTILFRTLNELVDGKGDRSGFDRKVRLEIDALVKDASAEASSPLLELTALLGLLEGRFDSSGAAGGFLGGTLTLCSMVPMRSIPFRVVCLLGLDDNAFPRTRIRASFDKLEQQRKRGDRTLREDDRSIFLEAILAARDHLIVTYDGRSVTTNEPLAPAVPVGELLDVLDATFEVEGAPGELIRKRLVQEHPLQAFSPRNFGADSSLGPTEPSSYDRRALAGARQLHELRQGLESEERSPAPLLDGQLEPPKTSTADGAAEVSLLDLIRFLKNPVKFFLQQRVGLQLESEKEQLEDREPIELGGLERHGLGTSLLDWDVRGDLSNDAETVLRGGGRLPIGTPGRYVLKQIDRTSRIIASKLGELEVGERSEPIDVSLDYDDLRLSGRLMDVWGAGLLQLQYGKVRADQRLALWVRHLALSASDSGHLGPSLLVGQDAEGEAEVVSFPAVDAEVARKLLGELLQLYLSGLRAPLMFFPETSYAYATTYASALAGAAEPAAGPPVEAEREARKEASSVWIRKNFGGGRSWGEGTSVWVERILGEAAPCPAAEGFEVPGLDDADAPEFHDLALAVWRPLLEHEATGGER